jgi:hypothetical protein
VEDGILLKIFVEDAPATYKVSNVDTLNRFLDVVVLKRAC